MNQTGKDNRPENFRHVPVLSKEAIAGLALRPGGHYLDATVGAGGHSSLILAAVPAVRLTAIDRDSEAIAAARSKLGDRVEFWQGNFADYTTQSPEFDGILADLGVSSPQFDRAERGFSFQQEAPLDMRMDGEQSLTAAEIVNHWDERSLADLIYQYGEERLSRRIAKRITERRPLQTTVQLAETIAGAVPRSYRYGRIHPATRTFQALRIAVNDELESLKRFLTGAPNGLKAGGRIVIISFHSLEDRIVKQQFRADERLQIITKKPLVAQAEEIANNPRARSAKLRVAERGHLD